MTVREPLKPLQPGTRNAVPRAAAPIAVLAAGCTALAVVATRDPEHPGHYPVCPFHSLTGLWCPGCGSLRTLHALSQGDVSTALHRNVLAIAALPFLALAWMHWLGRAVSGRARSPRTAPAAVLWAVLGLVVAFGVLRNLPFGQWLAPQS
jgi:hypothetical protein